MRLAILNSSCLFARVAAHIEELFTALNLTFVIRPPLAAPEVSCTLHSAVRLRQAVQSCPVEAMAGILVPSLLSQVLRGCSRDGCAFTQGSFTCKICNFHIQLHELGPFQPVLSPSYPLAAPASFLVDIMVESDLVLFRILDLNGGTPPLTYKRFLHILSLLGDPEVPVRNLTAEDFQ